MNAQKRNEKREESWRRWTDGAKRQPKTLFELRARYANSQSLDINQINSETDGADDIDALDFAMF